MNGIGTFIIVIAAIAFFVLIIIAAFKESKTTGTYRSFGVYGRIKAYLFTDFLIVGIGAPISAIIRAAVNHETFQFSQVIIGVIVLVIAFLIYRNCAKKCPDFLRKKLFISLLISGMGIAFKICIFFIVSVWKITGPKEIVDENGRELLMYDGKVYTTNGEYVGEASDDRKSFVEVK